MTMLNVVIVQGRIVFPPSLKEIREGLKVCSFVIESDMPPNENGNVRMNQFTVSIYGEHAEKASNLRKGLIVLVRGKLKTSRWKDKNDEWKERVGIDAIEIIPEGAFK